MDGRNLVVYVDADEGLPQAFFTEAESAYMQRDDIRLSDGGVFRGCMIHYGDEKYPVDRPRQQNIRWDGFAAMFPGCAIYQSDD